MGHTTRPHLLCRPPRPGTRCRGILMPWATLRWSTLLPRLDTDPTRNFFRSAEPAGLACLALLVDRWWSTTRETFPASHRSSLPRRLASRFSRWEINIYIFLPLSGSENAAAVYVHDPVTTPALGRRPPASAAWGSLFGDWMRVMRVTRR